MGEIKIKNRPSCSQKMPYQEVLISKARFLTYYKNPEKNSSEQNAEISNQSHTELENLKKYQEHIKATHETIKKDTELYNRIQTDFKEKTLEKKRARLEEKGQPIPAHLESRKLEIAYKEKGKKIDIEETLRRIEHLKTPYKKGDKGMLVNNMSKTEEKILNQIEASLKSLQLFEKTTITNDKKTPQLSEEEQYKKDMSLIAEWNGKWRNNLKQREQQGKWVDKPEYKTLNQAYSLVIENPILRDRGEAYEVFYGNQYLSSEEMKNWYLAYLAVNTNGFSDDGFVLGNEENFDPLNEEENRKNHPKAFALWAKKNGIDVKDLEERQHAVNEKQKEIDVLQLQGHLPKLSDIELAYAGILDPYRKNSGQPDYFPPFENLDEKSPNYWDEQEDWIGTFIEILGQIKDAPNMGHEKETIEKTIQNLLQYKELAKLQDHKHNVITELNDESARFNRMDLNKDENKQESVEISMGVLGGNFQDILRPYNIGEWDHFNKRVVGILAVSMSQPGYSHETVDAFGRDEKKIGPYDGTAWMLSQIIQSPNLNATAQNETLNDKQHEVLAYALAGSKVINDLRENELKRDFFDLLGQFKGIDDKNSEEAQNIANQIAENYPTAWIQENAGLNVSEANKRKQEYEDKVNMVKTFKSLAEQAIANVNSKAADDLKKGIEEGNFNPILSSQEFKAMVYSQKQVEENFEVLTREAQSRVDILEASNIDVKGFALAFDTLERNIRGGVKGYEAMEGVQLSHLVAGLLSPDPETFNKYYKALEITLAQSEGNEALLAGARILNRNIREGQNIKDFNSDAASILEQFYMLQQEGYGFIEMVGEADFKSAEIRHELTHVSLWDKSWNFIVDSKDAILNIFNDPKRGVLYGGLIGGVGLGIMKAWNYFSGKTLTFWDYLVLGGAASGVVAYEMTGLTPADLAGEGFEKTLERGPDGVLLEQSGLENLEDKKLYARTLIELEKGSVNQWLNWYKRSDVNGAGQDHLLPANTDLSFIHQDRRIAKRSLKQAIEKQALFINNERNKGSGGSPEQRISTGLQIMEEIYIHPFRPNYKSKNSGEILPPILIAKYKNYPNGIPWKDMKHIEVDVFDIQQNIGKHGIDPYLELLAQARVDFINWNREQYADIQAYVNKVLPEIGDKAGEMTEFVVRMGEIGAKKLKATGREISFVVKGEVYRVVVNSITKDLQLVKESIKGVVIGAVNLHDWTADSLTEIVQKGTGLINTDTAVQLTGSELTGVDVAGPGTEDEQWARMSDYDRESNPGFGSFGFWQRAFYKASQTPERFFITPSPQEADAPYFDKGGVGYYFSEVELSEVNIPANAGEHEKREKMLAESQARAARMFKSRGVTEEQLKYVIPVHEMYGLNPEKIVIAWRAPLPNSPEMYERETGKYIGYPNKHTVPFEFDRSQPFLKQAASAFGHSIGPNGVLILNEYVLSPASHLGTIPAEIWRGLGMGAIMTNDFITANPEISNFLNKYTQPSPETQTNWAEFTHNLDYSPFYDEATEIGKQNRTIYDICFKHSLAVEHRYNLYLGILEGTHGYAGTEYLKAPVPKPFPNLLAYYKSLQAFYEKNKGPEEEGWVTTGKKFRVLVEAKIKELETGVVEETPYHLNVDSFNPNPFEQ